MNFESVDNDGFGSMRALRTLFRRCPLAVPWHRSTLVRPS